MADECICERDFGTSGCISDQESGDRLDSILRHSVCQMTLQHLVDSVLFMETRELTLQVAEQGV